MFRLKKEQKSQQEFTRVANNTILKKIEYLSSKKIQQYYIYINSNQNNPIRKDADLGLNFSAKHLCTNKENLLIKMKITFISLIELK